MAFTEVYGDPRQPQIFYNTSVSKNDVFDVSRDEVTSGSIPKSLVLLTLPLFAQNLLSIASEVVDTFWVGRLGDAAVASVGVTFPLLTILFALSFIAPRTGVQVLVSQRHGSENDDAARRAAFHGIVAAAALGAVVGVLVAPFSELLLTPLTPNENVRAMAATYLTIQALGLPILAVTAVIDAAYIGWGDTRAAAGLTLVAVAVNLTLDPILILGLGPAPQLEVAGAAIATVLGNLVAAVVGVAMVLGLWDTFTLDREAVEFDRLEFQVLLGIGLPISGRQVGRDVVRLFMYGIVSAVGGAAGLAAYVIGARIATIAFVPTLGLQEATQTMIGQNLGASQPDRADRTTWVAGAFAGVGLVAIGAAQLAAPGALTTLFVPDAGPETLELSILYLQILAFGYWGIGLMNVFIAAFNGSRHTSVTMVADYLKYWAVRLPVAAVGAYVLDFGVAAAFWGVTISNVVGAIGLGAYYVYTRNNGMLERAAEVAAEPAD